MVGSPGLSHTFCPKYRGNPSGQGISTPLSVIGGKELTTLKQVLWSLEYIGWAADAEAWIDTYGMSTRRVRRTRDHVETKFIDLEAVGYRRHFWPFPTMQFNRNCRNIFSHRELFLTERWQIELILLGSFGIKNQNVLYSGFRYNLLVGWWIKPETPSSHTIS